MKLTINYINRASKVLDFTEKEIEEYAKRVVGHLNKCGANGVTKNQIIQSVFIIKDIKEKQLQEKAKELHIKNQVIRKYQKEIKELSLLGLGTQRISNELKSRYKVNISSSSIYRFLKEDNNNG